MEMGEKYYCSSDQSNEQKVERYALIPVIIIKAIPEIKFIEEEERKSLEIISPRPMKELAQKVIDFAMGRWEPPSLPIQYSLNTWSFKESISMHIDPLKPPFFLNPNIENIKKSDIYICSEGICIEKHSDLRHNNFLFEKSLYLYILSEMKPGKIYDTSYECHVKNLPSPICGKLQIRHKNL